MQNWEKNVRLVTPYTPGEQPKAANIIKLNTNENPYPPSPKVAQALARLSEPEQADRLRRYPDPTADDLVTALSERYGMPKDQIFVGVGSDDVLAMSFMTFFNSEKPLLFPDITYSFYDVWAEEFRIPYETIPLDEHFEICPEDYDRPCGGVIFPNPNAPTGALLGLETVENMVASHPDVVVIVDEAYIDFGGESALPLVDRYENLLVVQTFSKSRSLAGLRIGYAFGSRKLIKYLNDVKYSFNSYTMNLPAIAAGTAGVQDEAYFQETRRKIIGTREKTKQVLRDMGFIFKDSQANFLFATHPKLDAGMLFEELKAAGIYVRYFNRPRIDQYLRITIGTDAEMEALTAFLERRLQEA